MWLPEADDTSHLASEGLDFGMIIKDVVEATKIRLRSPYFGYAALAFIGFNWKAFFLLSFTAGTAVDRLAAFDGATSLARLAIYPLLVGIFVASSSEWMKLVFNWISSYPARRISELDLTSEHLRLMKTAELEKARSTLMEAREAELLRRAKQDEALSEISDEDTKRRVAAQLSDYRRDADEKSNQPPPLPSPAIEILKHLSESKSDEVRVINYLEGDTIIAGKFELTSGSSPRLFTTYIEAIKTLEKRGHLVKRGQGRSGAVYTLTSTGWEQADQIGAAST